jgi:predicted protein tyrosine phosphatase
MHCSTAKRLGAGKEQDAIGVLEQINPHSRPNKSIVWLTDEILERDRKLYDIAYKSMWLTN